MEYISREELKKILKYNKETGVFTWIEKISDKVVVGTDICSKRKDGYIRVQINKKRYLAHRLAWLYVYGEIPKVIDHINRDTSDNRIENLRNVDTSTNSKNTKKYKNNNSGKTGVSFVAKRGVWVAEIKNKNDKIWLGYFENFEDAVEARVRAEKKYNYTQKH